MLTHQQLRTKALADAPVKAEFDKLSEEFSQLDEFLKATTFPTPMKKAPESAVFMGAVVLTSSC
jgi:hypothetical protein